MIRTANRRGMSLLELLVSIGIMSVIMLGAFQVFIEGLRLFRTNQAATDAQGAALRTLGALTAEMVNAKDDLIAIHDSPEGVVFASSIDANGKAKFDENTGKIYWQRLICYYYVPNATEPGKGKLIRKEMTIPAGAGNATGVTGDTNVTTVANFLSVRDTAYFASEPGIDSRTLGHDVYNFAIDPFSGQIEDATGTRDYLGGASVSGRRDSYDIRLEAGNKDDRGPNGYYIRVDTRVTPRG